MVLALTKIGTASWPIGSGMGVGGVVAFISSYIVKEIGWKQFVFILFAIRHGSFTFSDIAVRSQILFPGLFGQWFERNRLLFSLLLFTMNNVIFSGANGFSLQIVTNTNIYYFIFESSIVAWIWSYQIPQELERNLADEVSATSLCLNWVDGTNIFCLLCHSPLIMAYRKSSSTTTNSKKEELGEEKITVDKCQSSSLIIIIIICYQ